MKKKHILILFCFILGIFITLQFNFDKSMSPEDYVFLGNQLGMEGDHVGASKVFKRSIQIDPYFIPAYLGLGIAYGNLGRNNDAVDVFKEGIKLGNIHAFVPQMQMGIATIAYNKMNDVEIAVKYLKKALQTYTDQGDYAGVALAGKKLKQISTKP
jgi:tetratricopeptide (TPR) repeat protein